MTLLRWGVASLALTAIFGGQVLAQGDAPTVGSFGVLNATSAESAQTKLQAWLKQAGKTDAATQQQFQTIWKQSHRSVMDRVADSLALGSTEAAKLLREADSREKPAPAFADDAQTVKTPDVLTNKKLDGFFRSNLALAYARRLVHRGIYEEALAALQTTKAEQVVDPASYLFHRAVCEHGTLEQKGATDTINRLLEEVIVSPERYKTVAVLMLLDMQTWKEKDLASIARQMKNIERRLDLARGGPKTQRLQRKVIFRLDEIIKKLENDQKKKQGGG